MAIKELYIPADRGTMDPLVNYDELYSFDIDFFITSDLLIAAPAYGSRKIELAKNLAFSKSPIDIPSAYNTMTNPSTTDIAWAILLFTAYNKDKSKNTTTCGAIAGWHDPTSMESSMPIIRKSNEENKYVLRIRAPYERIVQFSATAKLEKIGTRQYRTSIYDVKVWCSNME